MNRLRDTPQSLGLPPIEKFRDDYPNQKARISGERDLSTREILFEYVLRNKFIWVLAFAQFFNGLIRTAVNDWSMLYLIEMKNYSTMQAGFCVCWFEIGGFLGMLSAGWASDVIFKGKRNPINMLYTTAVIFLLFAFKMIILPWPLLDAVFLFLFGFFIFGPQMLIGLAAAELSHKKAAATATGFAGCFAYLGAAAAGGPLGALMNVWGWNSYLLTLLFSAVFGALVVLPFWSIKTNPKEDLPEPEKA